MLSRGPLGPFTLDAGPVHLDVELVGDAYPEAAELIRSRLAAFVGPPTEPADVDATGSDGARRHGRRVHCTFEFSDEEWLAPSGGSVTTVPVAHLEGDDWHAEWPYYRGVFGPTQAQAVLAARAPSLEHALRAAAVFSTMPPCLYFHAAAVVYEGRAWLVPGHPNAGKSTLAREGAADRVISNEIAVVEERRPGEWYVLPSPFWGSGDDAVREHAAPLAGIAVLEQAADRNRWTSLEGGKAIAALMPHVACQAAAQLADGAVLRRVTDLAGAVRTWSLAWYRPSHPLEGLAWNR